MTRAGFRTDATVARAAAERFARYGEDAAVRASKVALDLQSVAAREVLARMIDPDSDYATLAAQVQQTPHARLGAGAAQLLCSLGRVVGLQNDRPEDVPQAIALFRAARGSVPVSDWASLDAKAFAHVLWEHRELEALRTDAELLKRLPRTFREILEIDLEGLASGVGSTEWMRRLNRYLLSRGVAPIELSPEGRSPFDRLRPGAPRVADRGPLISVVMPSFRPGPESITAVRSIVDQTWQDWELLVVDDASGPEFADVFEAIERMDPRIRVLRQPVNRGTYAARNRGLETARGEFITFQDIDDWSHPERLERQVGPLLADPALMRTQSLSVRCTEALVFLYLGYNPTRSNASSVLFRRSALDRLGSFDWVRKGADSEFDRRMEVAFPGRLLLLDEPLAFVRLEPESLSRGDFRPGWMHPARAEYIASMAHWHLQIEAGASPRMPDDVARRPFPAPRPFLRGLGLPEQLIDIAFVADWTMHGATQRACLEEMLALSRAGWRVGLIHARSMFSDAPPRAPLAPAVRRAIAQGLVTFVSFEETDHIPTVVVRQPDVLEFPTTRPVALTTDRVLVVAGPSSGAAEHQSRWHPADCDHNCKTLFGIEGPEWVARDEASAAALAADVEPERIARRLYPDVVSVHSWPTPGAGRSTADRPVVGWISEDHGGRVLQGTAAALLSSLPVDDSFDVRVLHHGHDLETTFDDVPPTWLVCTADEISARELVHQVEFFLGFPASGPTDEAHRSVSEALAAGCVAVLGEEFAPYFGDAALYCTPERAPSVVRDLRADRHAFMAQARRGREWAVARFADAGLQLAQALGLDDPAGRTRLPA